MERRSDSLFPYISNSNYKIINIMSSIKKENRKKKAANHLAKEEEQARKVIRSIIIALVILGVLLVAYLSMA